VRLRVACALLLLAGAGSAQADVFRPAYLEVRESGADQYEVMWKLPLQGDLRPGVRVRFPAGTIELSPRQGMFGDAVYVERWRITRPGGLAGQALGIDGIAEGVTDVIVRIERADGTSQVERLLPQRPEFTVTVLKQRLSEAELLPLVAETAAMVVRSETKITRKVIEAAPKLRVVGRAGVGVDNVDVEAATQRGIVVMNTPSGNTISTAELTFSMLMALARKIPQANASMKAGEWNRKSFQGVELYGKTLGILGMGRIGSEVARRAIAFGMRVLAYDPFLALSRAKALQVELVELNDIYPQADFITVHMPMTDETKGMVNQAAFAKMKKGVRILNCARGGIIQEADLFGAIQGYLPDSVVSRVASWLGEDPGKTRAAIEPTERSIPPEMMTKVIPSATMPV